MTKRANDNVILVNECDEQTGVTDKMTAHKNGGLLHRAFSVLIFNSKDDMLIQLRASSKYHFGGLWTNACCGHPQPDESILEAAARRLPQEFGFQTRLEEAFSFLYQAHDPVSGLTEREWDHVVEGRFDGTPQPNPEEIEDYRWIAVSELLKHVRQHPDQYTPWFSILLKQRF